MPTKKKQLVLLLVIMLPLSMMAQHQKVTLSISKAPVSRVLRAISQQTGLDFVYSNTELSNMGNVSVEAKGETVEKVLNRIFAGTEYSCKFENNTIIVKHTPSQRSDVDKSTVTGTVTDEMGEPLPGVTVRLANNNSATVTTANGTYKLHTLGVKSGTLLFSYLGMKNHEVRYVGQRKVDVVMEEADNTIDDVVVTGYGTYNRGQYVGAVNQVRAEDILVANESSIDQMLQGVIPGMSVVNVTGKVGGTPKIRIRGTSTLLGNQEPLWVVDGVIQTDPTPIPNDASPLSSDMDDMLQTAGNAISWLNPADIETITVLKDASATAIYGSQASNGVIVITTKKAKPNQALSINYNGSLSITQRPSYGLYDMMNSQQYMEFQQQAYHDRNAYTNEVIPIAYAGIVQQLQRKQITAEEFEQQFREMENMNTDWFSLLFHTPVSTNQNVSLSGGSEKLQSRFSVGFNSQPGVARKNSLLSVTANSNTTFRPTAKVSIDLSLAGSYRKNKDYFSGVSPYDYAMKTTRAIPAYNADGSYYYYPVIGRTSTSILNRNTYNYNILNEIDNTGNRNTTQSVQATLAVRWDVIKHLQFQGDASLSLATVKTKSWATELSNYISQIRGYETGEVVANSTEELSSPLPHGGMLNMSDNQTLNYSFRGALVYTNTFAKKHAVTLNIGAQATSTKVDGNTALRYGYLRYRGESFANVPDHSALETAVGFRTSTNLNSNMTKGTSITNTTSNQLSEYMTAVYSFDNRYVVNFNARLDASNRFGQDENKRFNPTFSLGGKWRIGEEPWMQWAKGWYDMFDISFSYGWRGNAVTEVSPYLIARDGGLHENFNQYYLSIISLPYPDLGWEKTKDWNLGAEFSFFDGRLSAGFNYYRKVSNVISSATVGAEYGVDAAYIDGTKMKNYGYELIASGTPIRTKDWTWSLSFNTSRDYNRVENNDFTNSPSDYLNGTAIVRGEAYGTLYAFDFAGLDPETGEPTFNKMDPETVPTDFRDFLVKVGNVNPDISGGLSTSLRYKNFHLRAQFAMSFGAQAFLPTYFATTGLPTPDKNLPTYMFKRWRQPGDEQWTDIPSIPAGNPNDTYIYLTYLSTESRQVRYSYSLYDMYNKSTVRVADTDFIRCRNISLQYDLPRSIYSRIGMRNAYVTASLTNPFFIAFDSKWEGRDPETASWPARKSFTLSVNLTF